MNNIEEYLKQRDRIKKAMNNLKVETAQELGYDQVSIPYNGGDMTSRNFGLHTGPVGGVVVKKLIALGEEQLMKQYGPNNKK